MFHPVASLLLSKAKQRHDFKTVKRNRYGEVLGVCLHMGGHASCACVCVASDNLTLVLLACCLQMEGSVTCVFDSDGSPKHLLLMAFRVPVPEGAQPVDPHTLSGTTHTTHTTPGDAPSQATSSLHPVSPSHPWSPMSLLPMSTTPTSLAMPVSSPMSSSGVVVNAVALSACGVVQSSRLTPDAVVAVSSGSDEMGSVVSGKSVVVGGGGDGATATAAADGFVAGASDGLLTDCGGAGGGDDEDWQALDSNDMHPLERWLCAELSDWDTLTGPADPS